MVRNRKMKTDYGLHSEKDMAEAIQMVESGVSLRKAANEKHVNFMTLQRYVQKKNKRQTDVYTFPKNILQKFNIC